MHGEMNISRRTSLKTALGAVLAGGLPVFMPTPVYSRAKKLVREFRFSASPASVNLGQGSDFVAWTYDGKIPGPEIRVREGDILRVVLKIAGVVIPFITGVIWKWGTSHLLDQTC